MTLNENLIAYLAYYPETATIAVPVGQKQAAEPIPNVTVTEHDEYYNEFFDANGVSLARVVFPQ